MMPGIHPATGVLCCGTPKRVTNSSSTATASVKTAAAAADEENSLTATVATAPTQRQTKKRYTTKNKIK